MKTNHHLYNHSSLQPSPHDSGIEALCERSTRASSHLFGSTVRILRIGLCAVPLLGTHSSTAGQTGYVNRPLVAGMNLMANPFNRGSNTLNEVIPIAPEGAKLYKFDNGTQRYETTQTFSADGGWLPGGL